MCEVKNINGGNKLLFSHTIVKCIVFTFAVKIFVSFLFYLKFINLKYIQIVALNKILYYQV